MEVAFQLKIASWLFDCMYNLDQSMHIISVTPLVLLDPLSGIRLWHGRQAS